MCNRAAAGASVADLLASAPVAVEDEFEIQSDRPSILNLIGNDVSNATFAHISGVSITSGGGSVSLIGGQVVFDPGTAFDNLPRTETRNVQISYELITDGV